MKPATKAVLLEGLRGAAEYGTASALKDAGISALAKTGTILMPNGAALGLVVALTPADKPIRGIVVAAPGGAGLDAAAIAAEIIKGRDTSVDPTGVHGVRQQCDLGLARRPGQRRQPESKRIES